MKTLLILLFLSQSAACYALHEAQARARSSGFTGCAPKSNEISDYDDDVRQVVTWVAACSGQKFRCMATRAAINCSPAAAKGDVDPAPEYEDGPKTTLF